MGEDDRGFRFGLSAEEKRSLLDLARWSILQGLKERQGGAGRELPPPPKEGLLKEKLGVFVTLKLRGRLRGCIGNVIGDRPLYRAVAAMARHAAFDDSRFAPLTQEEFAQVELDISVLSPLTPCPDPALVQVGRHGLVVRRGGRSGLLLPQVAPEWGWDRETFLEQTCHKAGLEPGCWRDDETELFWFEAEVFSEGELS